MQCLCDDFNRGDKEHTQKWRDLTHKLSLVDVAAQGDGKWDKAYTWSCINQSGERTYSRLDKIFASGDGYWISPPSKFKVDYTPTCSYRMPIIFSWKRGEGASKHGQAIFKMNISHLKDKRLMSTFKQAWSNFDEAHLDNALIRL